MSTKEIKDIKDVDGDAAVKEMTNGTLFTGFFEKDGNVIKKPTYVFYEPSDGKDAKDKGSFYWSDVRIKKEGNQLLLQQITDVFQGKKGPIFSEAGASNVDSTRTFALGSRKTTPNRTLNLEASSQAVRDAWMNGLKEIFAKKGQPSDAAVLLGGGGVFTGYFIDDSKTITQRPLYVWYEAPEAGQSGLGAFYWQEVRDKSSPDNHFPLATISDVYPTKKARIMQSAAAADAVAAMCLSVESKKTGKSLNLVASSEALKLTWLGGLQHVFKAKKPAGEAASPRATPAAAAAPAVAEVKPAAPAEVKAAAPAEAAKPAEPAKPAEAKAEAKPAEPAPAAAPAETKAPAVDKASESKTAPVEVKAEVKATGEVAVKVELAGVDKKEAAAPAAAPAPKPEVKAPVKIELPAPAPIKPHRPVAFYAAGEPGAAKKGPIAVDLQAGPKVICRCGQSKDFPYCDNTCVQINREKFTNYSGLKLDRVEFGQNIAYICGCGYAKGLWSGRPYCDGTDAQIVDLERGL